jgi:CheY-like chemotaxis protein
VHETTPRPRVLLADDDAGICKAITRLLSPTCDVVGPAADSETLLEMVARERPDVVLLDFSLPGGASALEVCRRIKATTPEVQVVAFTANDDADLERLAFEEGATGFVWKPKAWTDLLPTIRSVLAGTPRSSGAGSA